MVTARGNPSGTATTIIVIARMNAFKIPFKTVIVSQLSCLQLLMIPRIIRAKNVRAATPTPKRPIDVAIRSSLAYRGVISSSTLSNASVFPIYVREPTAQTTPLPLPVSMRELLITKGQGI